MAFGSIVAVSMAIIGLTILSQSLSRLFPMPQLAFRLVSASLPIPNMLSMNARPIVTSAMLRTHASRSSLMHELVSDLG